MISLNISTDGPFHQKQLSTRLRKDMPNRNPTNELDERTHDRPSAQIAEVIRAKRQAEVLSPSREQSYMQAMRNALLDATTRLTHYANEDERNAFNQAYARLAASATAAEKLRHARTCYEVLDAIEIAYPEALVQQGTAMFRCSKRNDGASPAHLQAPRSDS